MNFPDWLVPAILALVGALVGAYTGVKVALARLQERVKVNEGDIATLRQRSHDVAGMVQGHEFRLDGHEKRLDHIEKER